MKTRFTFILLLFLKTATSYGLTDTIPNGGFERWFISQWYAFPAEWVTNNTQLLAPGVVEDPDAYSGNIALGLTNVTGIIPEASCYFRINGAHFNIGGYVKNHLPNNDSAVFTIRMYSSSVQIDSGRFVFYGGFNPNYTSFTIPITSGALNVDSCTITISGGQNFNSSISFDDLQFDFILGIPDIEKDGFVIYPNPSRDGVYFCRTILSGKVHCSITDLTGKMVDSFDAISGYNFFSFDTKLATGVYILTLSQNGFRSSHRLLRL